MDENCAVFAGAEVVFAGPLDDCAAFAYTWHHRGETAGLLVFSDLTGCVVDLDLSGSATEVLQRVRADPEPIAEQPVQKRTRGRPRLGVVAKEVTLLPKHWAWLRSQPKSASATLRRLVAEKMRASVAAETQRKAVGATYSFMSAIAGDYPGFEAASRELFGGNWTALEACIVKWPADVQAYVLHLLRPAVGD